MRRPLGPLPRRRARGFVLITVLWVGLGLLMAVSSFMVLKRQDAMSGRAEMETSRAVEMARSGLNVALADLARPADEAAPRDGRPLTITMAEGQVTYRIQDESGKLDVNVAPIQLLRAALAALAEGTSADAFDTSNIADAIVARRERAGGPIRASELRRLLSELGLPRSGVDRALTILTTYNFDAEMNVTAAPRDLLAAIPGLGASGADDLIARRADGRPVPQLGSAGIWLSTRAGPVYSIEADAVLTSGLRAKVRAYVMTRGLSFRGGLMRYDIVGYEIVR